MAAHELLEKVLNSEMDDNLRKELLIGRHGDRLSVSGKPFKNPVIMADEGALLFPHDMAAALARPYLGAAVRGVSKIQENTVHQGYSLYIPVRLEVN